MRKKNTEEYTLKEHMVVSGVVGIISILIAVISTNIVLGDKTTYYLKQEDKMIKAALQYVDVNKYIKPINDGEIFNVSLEELINTNFIKEIQDRKSNICNSKNSYVEGYLLNNEFIYNAYLDCSDYNSKKENKKEQIDIETDYNNNLKEPVLTIKVSDKENGLSSYNYKIYNDEELLYTSDNFMTDNIKDEITKIVSLKKYVNRELTIEIVAVNKYGISNTKKYNISLE